MNAITLSFQTVIQDAHTAQRAYNKHGADAGISALASLEDRCEALRGHLAIESCRVRGQEKKA